MNNFTKELTMHYPLCPKCNSSMNSTAAVFWNNDFTMNDFTKEELMQIMWAIHREFPLPTLLGDKIQAMIENYCEHESDGLIYHQWFGEEKHNCCSCIKCGEFYK